MADEPIPISRADYAALYGAPATAVPDAAPIPISRADYAAMYGGESTAAPVSQSSMLGDLLSNVWGGVKKAPGVAVDLVSSIPSGVSNLAHLPMDLGHAGVDAARLGYGSLMGTGLTPVGTPEESREVYDRLDRTFRGIGGIAGTVASGGTALGPIVGGAAGITAYNKLNQATGSDVATTPQEDLKQIEENVGVGALLGAVMKGGQKVVGNASELANTLDRKSLGTRASDYGKVSDTRTIESPEGVPETFLKASLDDLLENGKLGNSRAPATLTKVIDANAKDLSSQIGEAIKTFDDSSKTPVKPNFENALNYIAEGQVPADLVESYFKRLNNIEETINEQSGGKLGYLQKQKVAFGKSYDPADKVLSGFNRAIYKDLQSTIESHVPEVADLNGELAKYLVTEPIVNRSLKAKENASPLSKLSAATFTTGGIGLPALLGSVLGGTPGTIIGLGVGAGLKGLQTPTGQALAARVLRKGGPVLADIEAPLIAGMQAESGDDLVSENVSRPSMPAVKTFNTKVADIAKDLDADPAHLLAVMNFETGGKLSSDVKNKAGSGATGLIQFMPNTAKALTGADTKEAAIKILEDMSPTEQLDYVKEYLKPFKGKLDSLEDVYMAVLYPKAVGKDSDYALFKEGTKAYWQNKGLDVDKDGIITKAEAASKVRDYA